VYSRWCAPSAVVGQFRDDTGPSRRNQGPMALLGRCIQHENGPLNRVSLSGTGSTDDSALNEELQEHGFLATLSHLSRLNCCDVDETPCRFFLAPALLLDRATGSVFRALYGRS